MKSRPKVLMGGIPARDACVASAIAALFMAMASQNAFAKQDEPAAKARAKDAKEAVAEADGKEKQGKPEADKVKGNEKGGTFVGKIVKIDGGLITVKNPNAERTFRPYWRGGNPDAGGGFDKDMLARFKNFAVGDRVRVQWTLEEHPRIDEIKKVGGEKGAAAKDKAEKKRDGDDKDGAKGDAVKKHEGRKKPAVEGGEAKKNEEWKARARRGEGMKKRKGQND